LPLLDIEVLLSLLSELSGLFAYAFGSAVFAGAFKRFGAFDQFCQRPAEGTSDTTGEQVAWVLPALDSRYSGLVGASGAGYRLDRRPELFPA
jgi:hypothetical protein